MLDVTAKTRGSVALRKLCRPLIERGMVTADAAAIARTAESGCNGTG
jgi:hypothetical protein